MNRMMHQDFHSLDVTRRNSLHESVGLEFHLPKEYLEQMHKTNSALMRIETLLETLTQSQPLKSEAPEPKAVTEKDADKVIPLRETVKVTLLEDTSAKMPEEKTEIPFLSLRLASSPDFYKVSRTFLSDLEAGHRNFGFQRLDHKQDESFIAIFASFISYSKDNAPILMVIENFESEGWRKIRRNFSLGSIGGCRCYDWGNVSVIERREILKADGRGFKTLTEIMKKEFQAVFWSLGPQGIGHDFSGFSYFVLDSLNSVTLVVPKHHGKISKVLALKTFYADYKIPIKGLLSGN